MAYSGTSLSNLTLLAAPVLDLEFRHPLHVRVIADPSQAYGLGSGSDLAVGKSDGDTLRFHGSAEQAGLFSSIGIERDHRHATDERFNGCGEFG